MRGKRTSSGRSVQIETELDVDEPTRKKAQQSTDNTQRIRPVACIPRRRAPLSPFRSHQRHGVGERSQSKKGKERRRSYTPDEFASGKSNIDVRSKNWSKNQDTAPEDPNTGEEDESESSDDNGPQDSRSARGGRLVTKSSYYVEPVSAHQSSHQSTFQIVFHPPTPGHNQSSKPETKCTDHDALTERADARDKGVRRVTEEMRGMEKRVKRNIEALRDMIKEVVESSQKHPDRAETERSERDERARRGGQRGIHPQPPASTAARRQQGYTAKIEPVPPSLTRHRARASSPFQPNISSPPRRSCSSARTIPYPGSRDKVTVRLIRKLLGLGGRHHHRAWLDIRCTLRQVLDVSGFDLTVPYMVQAQSKRVKIIKEIEDAIPEFKRFEESWGAEYLARLTFQARRAGWERKNNTWSDEDENTD